MINLHDKEKIYCRKLGHYLTFKYCRIENVELPCSKITNCWSEKIPIDKYIDNNFTENVKSKIFKSQAPKIASLIDLIEKAKKNQ